MTTLAIISDTHIPSRAKQLPSWVVDELRTADIVVHAGDFDSVEAFELIDDLAQELVAVRGNTDPALDLPETATLDVDGISFVITHGTGPLAGYRDRVAEIVRQHTADGIGISGHTHELADITIGGIRLLNPGSATGAGPATRATMLRGTVSEGVLSVDVLDGC